MCGHITTSDTLCLGRCTFESHMCCAQMWPSCLRTWPSSVQTCWVLLPTSAFAHMLPLPDICFSSLALIPAVENLSTLQIHLSQGLLQEVPGQKWCLSACRFLRPSPRGVLDAHIWSTSGSSPPLSLFCSTWEPLDTCSLLILSD